MCGIPITPTVERLFEYLPINIPELQIAPPTYLGHVELPRANILGVRADLGVSACSTVSSAQNQFRKCDLPVVLPVGNYTRRADTRYVFPGGV